jgi:hypothetical protein
MRGTEQPWKAGAKHGKDAATLPCAAAYTGFSTAFFQCFAVMNGFNAAYLP